MKPYASGLVMCRDGVTEKLPSVENDLIKERKQLYTNSDTVLDEYAPPVLAGAHGAMQAIVRRQTGLLAWRNWDKFFDQ